VQMKMHKVRQENREVTERKRKAEARGLPLFHGPLESARLSLAPDKHITAGATHACL
jgi:hypothetical protein